MVDDAHEPVRLRLVAAVALNALRHVIVDASSARHDVTGLRYDVSAVVRLLRWLAGQLREVLLAWSAAEQTVAGFDQLQTLAVVLEAKLQDSHQHLFCRVELASCRLFVVFRLLCVNVASTVLAEAAHVAHRSGSRRSAVSHHACHVFVDPDAVKSIQRFVCE